jgi:hypothetical protein
MTSGTGSAADFRRVCAIAIGNRVADNGEQEQHPHMTRHLFPAILIGILAAPAAAGAQHTAGGAPTIGTAVPSSAPAPAPAPAPSGSSSSGGSSGSSASSGSTSSDPGRTSGGLPITGRAVPRGSTGGGNGGPIIIGGSPIYPWGWGLGGAIAYGGYYGGYYGEYDPWYGWSPLYSSAAYGSDSSGAIRLKVKPVEASVYVDGFYAGIVDDFDGTFQRLHLDPGPHRIEMRKLSYQPLAVDVMIQEDFTITFRGELAKQ